MRGVWFVLLIFGICFIPWFCVQTKFARKVLTETYEQNLRMEVKIDSLRILRNKDDSAWRVNEFDSLIKNQMRIYDAIKHK